MSPGSPRVGTSADVVGEHVDAVVARPGHADLELARQVDVAVHRLGRRAAALGQRRQRRRHGDGLSPSTHSSQYAVGLGTEAGDQRGQQRSHHRLALVRPRAAHDVAHDVAARRQRGEQAAVDAVHELVQVALVDDVELHALTGGQAQRSVGELGQSIEGQPLLAADQPARHGGAHHARVVERQLLRCPFAAHVAVVLLVDAVELEQDGGVVLEGVGVGRRARWPGAAQVARWPRLTSSTLTAAS